MKVELFNPVRLSCSFSNIPFHRLMNSLRLVNWNAITLRDAFLFSCGIFCHFVSQIHTGKFNHVAQTFNFRRSAKVTESFTGCEIGLVFIETLYRAFEQEQEPTDLTIGSVLVDFVPLSKLMGESMTALRTWAQGACAPRHHAERRADHPEDCGMSAPTKIEREHYAKLIGRQITAIQWEDIDGRALPVLVLSGCRLFPQHGVFLVVTDERKCETCFGFFNFPVHILDTPGAILADTGLEGRCGFAILLTHRTRATGRLSRNSANGDLSDP